MNKATITTAIAAAIVGPDVGPLLPFAPIGYKATT
jgi:hypothetical protein